MFGVQINPKRVFIPGLESNHVVSQPILVSQRISKRCNALILQNAGNCNVVLDSGYTLFPRQTYMIGDYNELNVIKFDVNVVFDLSTATSEPVNPRLEVVEIITAIKGRGYYIDQPD